MSRLRIRSDALLDTARAATTMTPEPPESAGLDAGLVAKYGFSLASHIWRLCALAAFVATISSGCGSGHATLDLSAPSSVTRGTSFTVTVNVLYQGKPDTVINGVIHFTSSDPAAVLPIDYQFTRADAGSHTWTNGFILSTLGNQTISAAIHDAIGINGSATIAVSQ